MLHCDIHSSGACDEIHRTSHPEHFASGYYPVGHVAFLVGFKCANYRSVNVSAPYHPKRHATVKIAAARRLSYLDTSSVDQQRIAFAFTRSRPYAQHPIFRLKKDPFTVDMIRDHRRYPHTQIDKKVFLFAHL